MQKEIKEAAENFIDVIKSRFKDDTKGNKFKGIQEVEELMSELTQFIGNKGLQAFTNVKIDELKINDFHCKICNRKLKKHRKSELDYQTTFGGINIDYDVYLYCEKCMTSIRPLHSALGMNREKISLSFQKTIVNFGIDESGQKSAEKIKYNYPQVKIDRTKVIRVLHHHGELARKFILNKLDKEFKKSNLDDKTKFALELEVEYDGGMIPVGELQNSNSNEFTSVRKLPKRNKKCYWKEVKIGLVQGVNDKKEDRLYSIRFMNELTESFDDLLALAHMQDWNETTNVRGIADGAKYIKSRMEETFNACDFKFILDRPHAKEHLGEVAKELARIKGIDKDKWFDKALNNIENGNVDIVISELKKTGEYIQSETKKTLISQHDLDSKAILIREANYFEHNKDSIEYAKYRDNGWSTASGEVESAHRHIVQVRLKIPGAWWHPNNVPNILALRMLKANNWLDEYWKMQRNNWIEYGEYLKKIN